MNTFARAALLIATLALAACGGGGGGGGSGEPSKGGFSVSPTTLTFNAPSASGTTIGPQALTGTISGASPQTLFLNVQVTGQAVANVGNIAITGSNTGTASVFPVSQHILGPGTYTSVITVTACSTSIACTSGVIGSPQTVNVTYNITGVRSSVPQLGYQVSDAPTAADLTKTFVITGYPAQNWTATASVPWLSLSPTNGNAGASTTVTASLVSAVLESLASGTHTGTLTLSPSSGDPVTLPVSLTISRVRVNYVAPYVAISNLPRTVILRGENLTRFPIQDVRFGSHSATSFTVVSDTEVQALHPGLPAGTYPVTLVTSQAVRTRASLHVVNPLLYSSVGITYPQPATTAVPVCLVHDPERDSLLVGLYFANNGTGSSRLVRYSRTSNWAIAADVAIPNIGACTLTPDGKRVLISHLAAVNGNPVFAVSELDPVSLASQLQTTDPKLLQHEPYSMAAANDGRALITTGFRNGPIKFYSQLRSQIEEPTPSVSPYDGVVEASTDGSVIFVGSSLGGGGEPVRRYNSSSGQLVDSQLVLPVMSIALNRSGTRVAFTGANGARVYDGNLALMGNLPATTLGVALTPASQFVYTFDADGTNVSVRGFNVSTTPIVEVTPAIPLTINPGQNGTIRMLVTHDEGALFIAGRDGVILVKLL